MQNLSLCLKGRFYATVPFMYLMGIFYVKQVTQNLMHIATRISGFVHKEKILHHMLFYCMMITLVT